MKDKDYESMLAEVAPLAKKVVVAGLESERAESVRTLQRSARKYNPRTSASSDVASALGSLVKGERDFDFLVVAGSIYLAGEFLSLVERNVSPLP